MDLLSLLETSVIFIAILVVVCKLCMLRDNHMTKGVELPEPKGALPIIGHLHLLGGKTPLFRTLADMAEKNGPIFKIRLGLRQAVVVSSKETIMECLSINDQAFLSRPKTTALKYMGYSGAMFALAPHGPYWSEFRKVITNDLLSNRRLESMKCMRASEVDLGIRYLYSLCSAGSTSIKIDISRWFMILTMNVMTQSIAGRRFSFKDDKRDKEAWRFGTAMDRFMHLLGSLEVSDVIPIPGLEWMDLQGHVKSMKRNAEEMDYFMNKWLEEHYQSAQNGQTKEERDFMDVLVSLFPKGGREYGHKNEDFIKGTALSLIMGGSDTTTASLSWALSLLLNHENALNLIQKEIDMNVGRERIVEESDINNLAYLKASVKEVLRLYPAGPLSIPRESTEDCNIVGYHVPKGTRLIVHLWKLHRDPRVWDDPNEFRPERFLDNDTKFDLRRRQFEYLPFSYGRRSCPGMTMAFQMMHLTLARLLQSFNLATPMNKPIDMAEGLSLVLAKENPVEVMLSPRLPHKLYL